MSLLCTTRVPPFQRAAWKDAIVRAFGQDGVVMLISEHSPGRGPCFYLLLFSVFSGYGSHLAASSNVERMRNL